MEEPIPLSTLSSHFICKLCDGYLVEATAIIECLHTFCKTCIVKYLDDESNTNCPECKKLIHQSHPLSYIMADRTMQDIVNKAVPNLLKNEQERIMEFYTSRGMPIPNNELKQIKTSLDEVQAKDDNADKKNKGVDCNYHRDDTQVAILMEEEAGLPKLDKRYLQCSKNTTIGTLKRYICTRLYGTVDRYNQMDIFCQKELMGKEHTLEFVLCTRWRTKHLPLVLQYRKREDLLL